MVKKGELKKLEGIGKQAFFESNKGNHIHLIDQKTGEIVDVDIESLDLQIPNLPKNFTSRSLDIKIFGEFS